MRYMIYPYMAGSQGATAIRNALDFEPDEALIIRRENSRYVQRDDDVVISWGCPCPIPGALNANPEIVINKLDFFERLAGRGLIPRFATSKAEALRSLRFPIVCRTTVEGSDGRGIVIAETPDQLINCRLYVELVNKESEWRIHAGRKPDGEITIIAEQKKLHTPTQGIDQRVWTGDSARLTYNHNGAPAAVRQVVLDSMEHLTEMTFVGFDVAFDGLNAYVLEGNSAPMMTGETARLYADFFKLFKREPEVIVADEGNDQHVPVLDVNEHPIIAELRSLIERYTVG